MTTIRLLAVPVLFSLTMACSSSGGGAATDIQEDPRQVDSQVDTPDNGDLVTDSGKDSEDRELATDIPVDRLIRDEQGELPPDPVIHAGVTASLVDNVLNLANQHLFLSIHLGSGLAHVRLADGPLRVSRATAGYTLRTGLAGESSIILASDAAFVRWEAQPLTDSLGEGVTVTVHRKHPNGATFQQTWQLRSQTTFLTTDVRVQHTLGAPSDAVYLVDMIPFLAARDPSSGGLVLGADPSQHLVLDNGMDMYFDFVARVFRVGLGNSLVFPGRGSVANWNMAVFDPASKQSLVAGYLSFHKGPGLIALDLDFATPHLLEGRDGFTRIEGFQPMEPPLLVAQAGRREATTLEFRSDPFYLDLAPDSPQQGLESFASRFASWHQKKRWPDVPTGWNSWGGGGSSGGLATNIDESLILQNLDAMIRHFKPLGMRYFLIDDGWQLDTGDWVSNPQRFPDHGELEGMAWMAKHIEEQGLIPGIWISPFSVSKSAAVVKEHPDWWVDIGPYGGFVVGDNEVVPDLSRPDVQEWVRETFHRIRHEWGYKWIKIDFSYYAMFAENLWNPEVSPAQAYHDALKLIRETVGPDTFIVGISATGLFLDVADGQRTTLDNMPVWGDKESQGIKVTLVTAAHRYYLNHLLVHHPDLVFFRDKEGMTLGEARAWLSMVALFGGIVKLGEPYTKFDEHPEWLNLVAPLIPVHPVTARPLDLFHYMYPETWVKTIAHLDRSWKVVGLFNWGKNTEILSGTALPESQRTKTLNLAEVGATGPGPHLVMDSWTGECDWVDGSQDYLLQPRTEKLLVVHPPLDRPFVALTSRHLMGGVMEVVSESYDETASPVTFTATLRLPPGRPVQVHIASPTVAFTEVLAPASATLNPGACDGVVTVTFEPEQEDVVVEIRGHHPEP